ncbi:DNA mismatch repair protein Msh3-like [Mytilus edulis]|uniref:DNA mismatch repair protein Msh3-like n=1 Tax=Mytilus edulis TaxID=6550 RepID=UPI0039F02E10
MGDINYGQGEDRPRTLPTCVIGNQNSSHYCNDSRSRQTHSNFTTDRPSRMQNMQDLTLRYGQAVSISNLQNVDQRPVPEIHCQTVAHGFNRRAVSMANIPAVPVSKDNFVYATVQKKINEDQEEDLMIITKTLIERRFFTVNSSDDQKQEESKSRLKPQTCTSENIYDDPDETDEQEQQESQSSLRPLTCTSESIYDYPDQRGSRTKTTCRNSDTITMADSVDHSKSSATSSCETDGSNSEGYSYVTPPNKCLNSKDAHIGRNQTEVDSTQFMCEEKRHNYKADSIEVNKSEDTSDEIDSQGYTNMYPPNTRNDSDDKNNMCTENHLSDTEEDSNCSDKCLAHSDKYVEHSDENFEHSDKWEAPSFSSSDTWIPPKSFL